MSASFQFTFYFSSNPLNYCMSCHTFGYFSHFLNPVLFTECQIALLMTKYLLLNFYLLRKRVSLGGGKYPTYLQQKGISWYVKLRKHTRICSFKKHIWIYNFFQILQYKTLLLTIKKGYYYVLQTMHLESGFQNAPNWP